MSIDQSGRRRVTDIPSIRHKTKDESITRQETRGFYLSVGGAQPTKGPLPTDPDLA
jgi:hypothetical protein